ncbi:hypothetical protein [Nostoc sp. ChiQUE01b]|uniref:hypothetical protein n=1 Tax=Nostoc sp. ChiQUE01b TaxID=3075376 RepID=UPI002AD1F949|nr:hypothetical protein [Nostoc sp. ChiQUE01b]MDZ8261076.1 hypothetical protein [Nostoc sp. ChiQUE01b]
MAKKEIQLSYSQLKANFDKYIGNLNTKIQSKLEATVRDLQKSVQNTTKKVLESNIIPIQKSTERWGG